MTNLSEPTSYASGQATGYTFDPFEAQYVRVVEASGSGSGYNLTNEIVMFGPEQIWLLEGDANMDCRVNILDLIFIRNRLNQDTGTGDNWQADVNEDTKVNILDLIYVRNRLNTSCQ